MKKNISVTITILTLLFLGYLSFFGECAASLSSKTGPISEELSIEGNIVIPTYPNNKQFPAVFTMNQNIIKITCKKRIFNLFNNFDTPLRNYLIIDASEIEVICWKDKKIFLYPKYGLLLRYRNIFHSIYFRKSMMYSDIEEEHALIFELKEPKKLEKYFIDKLKEIFLK